MHLCTTPDFPDFAIFGALYCLRHGVELWLKGMLGHLMIDRTLAAIFEGASDVDTIAPKVHADLPKKSLQRTLCLARPALKRGVAIPNYHPDQNTLEYAREAIALIRANADLERSRFAFAWSGHINEHSLS